MAAEMTASRIESGLRASARTVRLRRAARAASRWTPRLAALAVLLIGLALVFSGALRDAARVLLAVAVMAFAGVLAAAFLRRVSAVAAASAWDRSAGWPDLMLAASELRRHPRSLWTSAVLAKAESSASGCHPSLDSIRTRSLFLAVVLSVAVLIAVVVWLPGRPSAPPLAIVPPATGIEDRGDILAAIEANASLPPDDGFSTRIEELRRELMDPQSSLESVLAAISSAEAAAAAALKEREAAIARAEALTRALAAAGGLSAEADSPTMPEGPDATQTKDAAETIEGLRELARTTADPALRELLEEAIGSASDGTGIREALARALERARQQAGSPADLSAWQAALAALSAARDKLTANSIADKSGSQPPEDPSGSRPGSGAGNEPPPADGAGSPTPDIDIPAHIATLSGNILAGGDTGLIEDLRSGRPGLAADSPEARSTDRQASSRLSTVASDRDDIPPSRLRIVRKYFESLQQPPAPGPRED